MPILPHSDRERLPFEYRSCDVCCRLLHVARYVPTPNDIGSGWERMPDTGPMECPEHPDRVINCEPAFVGDSEPIRRDGAA